MGLTNRNRTVHKGKKKMTVHTSENSKATIHHTNGITETLMSNLINAHANQIASLHDSYKAQLQYLKETIKEKNMRIQKLELELKSKI